MQRNNKNTDLFLLFEIEANLSFGYLMIKFRNN